LEEEGLKEENVKEILRDVLNELYYSKEERDTEIITSGYFHFEVLLILLALEN
jgi:methionine synthase II (cobalamin-independent)